MGSLVISVILLSLVATSYAQGEYQNWHIQSSKSILVIKRTKSKNRKEKLTGLCGFRLLINSSDSLFNRPTAFWQ